MLVGKNTLSFMLGGITMSSEVIYHPGLPELGRINQHLAAKGIKGVDTILGTWMTKCVWDQTWITVYGPQSVVILRNGSNLRLVLRQPDTDINAFKKIFQLDDTSLYDGPIKYDWDQLNSSTHLLNIARTKVYPLTDEKVATSDDAADINASWQAPVACYNQVMPVGPVN